MSLAFLESCVEIQLDRKLLGNGWYGPVFRGSLLHQEVAVKCVRLTGDDVHPQDALEQLVSHDNVVKLLGVETIGRFRCYAMELCHASLDQLFVRDDDPVKYRGPMPSTLDALLQLADGLRHIHENWSIHGDIKPENVLISCASQTVLLKWLLDFGPKKSIDNRGSYCIRGIKSLYNWTAPEILCQLAQWRQRRPVVSCCGNAYATPEADIFSLGCTFFYYLAGGIHPFGDLDANVVPFLQKFQIGIIAKNSLRQITTNILAAFPVNLHRMADYRAICEITVPMIAHEAQHRLTLQHLIEQVKSFLSQTREFLKIGNQQDPSEDQLARLNQLLVDSRQAIEAYRDELGRNCLMILCLTSAHDKLVDILHKLISQCLFDINERDRDGMSALMLLCRWSKKNSQLLRVAELLLKNGADVGIRSPNGHNTLMLLCWNNTNDQALGVAQLLIRHGVDVNCTDCDGMNALLLLCQRKPSDANGLLEIARILVENHVDVNQTDRSLHCNALMLLFRHNCQSKNLLDVVHLLLECGIDIRCRDSSQMNALMLLCQWCTSAQLCSITSLLLLKGVDIHDKCAMGMNALMLLCAYNNGNMLLEMARLLIRSGVDAKTTDKDGMNALMLLCAFNSGQKLEEVARLLADNGGTDVYEMDRNGNNALDLLRRRNRAGNSGDLECQMVQFFREPKPKKRKKQRITFSYT